MKPVPAPEGFAFEDLPTFDDLKEQTSLKVTQLRAKLAPVPCWKCSDNTVRYDADGVAEALADVFADEAPEIAIPTIPTEAMKDGGLQLLTIIVSQQNALLNKVLSVLSAREKQANETIRAMGEPLRVGVELSKANNDRLSRRNEDLEGNRDRVFKVLEDSLTAQNERELATQRAAASLKMKAETMDMLKVQLPTIVQKWGLTAKAAAAVKLLESLDPMFVDTIVKSGVLDPEQLALLQQLYPNVAAPAPEAAAAPKAESDAA